MKTKELYIAPEMEQILLKLEQGIIMNSPGTPGEDNEVSNQGEY